MSKEPQHGCQHPLYSDFICTIPFCRNGPPPVELSDEAQRQLDLAVEGFVKRFQNTLWREETEEQIIKDIATNYIERLGDNYIQKVLKEVEE